MRLELREAFQKETQTLDPSLRAALFDLLLRLPRAFSDAHRHAGLGLRKVHASGLWEARLGLQLRLLFVLERDVLLPLRILDHDGVRRYLKSL